MIQLFSRIERTIEVDWIRPPNSAYGFMARMAYERIGLIYMDISRLDT